MVEVKVAKNRVFLGYVSLATGARQTEQSVCGAQECVRQVLSSRSSLLVAQAFPQAILAAYPTALFLSVSWGVRFKMSGYDRTSQVLSLVTSQMQFFS